MKNLHKQLLRTSNWFLISLLGLFGISCSMDKDDDDLICMYGTPTALFTLKGKVVDTQNNPVQGAQIRITPEYKEHAWMKADTVYTDNEGNYNWNNQRQSYRSYRVITENPSLGQMDEWKWAADTTYINFTDKDKVKGSESGWHLGNFNKDTTFILKEYVDQHTKPYALYTIYGTVTGEDGQRVGGVLISSLPSYLPNPNPSDPSTYLAISNYSGQYSFTLELPAPAEHTLYTELYKGWWNSTPYKSDSVKVDFEQIPLSGEKGMLIGKGLQEVNIVLPLNSR